MSRCIFFQPKYLDAINDLSKETCVAVGSNSNYSREKKIKQEVIAKKLSKKNEKTAFNETQIGDRGDRGKDSDS